MKRGIIRVGPTPIWTLLHTSQVALVVKNLSANAGDIRDMVRPVGREDALEEGMATHSNILARRILWTEESGGYSLWGCKESHMTEAT